MRREEMADLTAFVVVAEARNFTRAAAKLGLSQSALSQMVRRLEGRLGLRLLARTTRSVAPTEAGERLAETLAPMLHDLDRSIAGLSELRDKPAGTIRITTVEHAAKTVLCPALAKLLPDYPDITVEVIADTASLTLSLADLMPGTLNRWQLLKDGREMRVRVDGPLVFNTIDLIRDAALYGLGLADLPLDQVDRHLTRGRPTRVLANGTPPLPEYHLYYPSRRHSSPAFKLLVDASRFRAPDPMPGTNDRGRAARGRCAARRSPSTSWLRHEH
ncbi:MAG: LysR family transcriptional regulator [Acetobacteraceae bacterium]